MTQKNTDTPGSECNETTTVTETHRALARSIDIWVRQDGVRPDFIANQLAILTATQDARIKELERLMEVGAEKITAFMGRCAEAEHDADQLAAALQSVRGDIHSPGMEEIVEQVEAAHEVALGWRDGTAANVLREELAEVRRSEAGLIEDCQAYAMNTGLVPERVFKQVCELGQKQADEFDRYWKAAGVLDAKVTVDDAIARYQALVSNLKTNTEGMTRYAEAYRLERIRAENAEAIIQMVRDLVTTDHETKEAFIGRVRAVLSGETAGVLPPVTFSLEFRGGYGETISLAKLAEILKGNYLDDGAWNWVANNRCKHLVVFIDTREDRTCRVYDRDYVALTLAQLEFQHGVGRAPEPVKTNTPGDDATMTGGAE